MICCMMDLPTALILSFQMIKQLERDRDEKDEKIRASEEMIIDKDEVNSRYREYYYIVIR